MIDKIYEWVKDLSFYLVLVTALLQMLPDSDYRKYIRFFTGLVLIALLLTPVLKTLHAGDLKTEILQGIYETGRSFRISFRRQKQKSGSR